MEKALSCHQESPHAEWWGSLVEKEQDISRMVAPDPEEKYWDVSMASHQRPSCMSAQSPPFSRLAASLFSQPKRPTACTHTLPGHIDLLCFQGTCGPNRRASASCLPRGVCRSASCWEAPREKEACFPSSLSGVSSLSTPGNLEIRFTPQNSHPLRAAVQSVSRGGIYSLHRAEDLIFSYFPGPTTSSGLYIHGANE